MGREAFINMMGIRLRVLVFLAFAVVTGCATGGVYHRVGKGETLWRICRTYGVSMEDVARVNNIKDSTEIETGRRIFIPGAKKRLKITPHLERASIERNNEALAVTDRPKFLWPVEGPVSSKFGKRSGVRQDGIDIRAAQGTPVKAADDGKVVYVSGTFRGYGNIIIIKHDDGFYTVYAHNKQNLVSPGDIVSRGDVIATVGNSGNTEGNHLHFEVRNGRNSVDPLFYLP